MMISKKEIQAIRESVAMRNEGKWAEPRVEGPITKHVRAVIEESKGDIFALIGLCEELEKKLQLTEKAKLGSGARFKAVEKSAAASGARNPAAVAAAAGIKAHGKKKMSELAAAGRKHYKKHKEK